ncbi:transketolase [Fervidobacterium changbaicum]|uniref:Transketolase n=1 Tax=Fervidobacterium changbaicum TaxID=310769 RepID=A0ABX5QS30_9BACT|nr:transketolase [Fervidobacterium changbaicum]SDH48144.1 transketolase [Fervidobacterium changbaicum]
MNVHLLDLTPEEVRFLKRKATQIRIITLEMIGHLGVGHVGGSLSIAEVLAVLYYKVMRIDPKNPKWDERDRFVLSKGHAGPALYSVLADLGYFPYDWIYTLNKPNTNLPSHCDRLKTPGVDMTAGSLGQGLSAAVGMALGAKIRKMDIRVFALIGDGESQEGQIWEAAMFASHNKLNNLIAFTDYNKMQIDGYIHEVNNLEPLADKWRAFNWHVVEVDGHNVEQIYNAIREGMAQQEKPTMIILHTIKGKGAFFAEGKVASHNMPIKEEELRIAVETLKKEMEQFKGADTK